jgi:hypothetical protein
LRSPVSISDRSYKIYFKKNEKKVVHYCDLSHAETPSLLQQQFFLSNSTMQLKCLQRAPWCRVTAKSQLFHTNRRSGWDRGPKRVTCVAGSSDNHQPSTTTLGSKLRAEEFP